MFNILIPVRKMFPVFHSSLLLLVLICFLCASLMCMHVYWSNKPNFHICLILGEIITILVCMCCMWMCGCVKEKRGLIMLQLSSCHYCRKFLCPRLCSSQSVFVSRHYITKCFSEVCILYNPIMLFDDYASWPQLKAASPNLSSVSAKGVTYGEGEG